MIRSAEGSWKAGLPDFSSSATSLPASRLSPGASSEARFTSPITTPWAAAKALGIDLVHFGVVVILNFMIAMITPPYGLILFVLSALTGVSMREINREIWQFCIPLTVVLFVLILFPDLTLGLPKLFGYGK